MMSDDDLPAIEPGDLRPVEPGGACARVVERLDALLEGDLPPLEAARDGGHLEACAACGAERARREGERADLAALLAPSADALAAAREGLAARLAAARPPGRTPRFTPVAARAATLAGLAAAGLLAIVGLEASGVVEGGLLGVLGGAERVAREAVLPELDLSGGMGAMVGGEEL